jgi:hypothetical protein
MLVRFPGGMPEPARTTVTRETVLRRVRRLTGAVAAASLAVAGSITGYVAGVGTQKSVGDATAPSRTSTATEVPVPATPTPPSLDSADSSSQAPLQSAPVQAPTQSASPPVAVSGGS